VRRIVRDYFSYEVKFVMNITDVDDKVCCYLYSTVIFLKDLLLIKDKDNTAWPPTLSTQTA
jgi:hypothetical protein